MTLNQELDWLDNTKLKMKSITINGLLEAITLTGLKLQHQMKQEKLSRMESLVLVQLLLSKRHLKNHKQMILPQDTMPNKKPLLIEKLPLELQELTKPEEEPKIQETQEDGELFGQLVH